MYLTPWLIRISERPLPPEGSTRTAKAGGVLRTEHPRSEAQQRTKRSAPVRNRPVHRTPNAMSSSDTQPHVAPQPLTRAADAGSTGGSFLAAMARCDHHLKRPRPPHDAAGAPLPPRVPSPAVPHPTTEPWLLTPPPHPYL